MAGGYNLSFSQCGNVVTTAMPTTELSTYKAYDNGYIICIPGATKHTNEWPFAVTLHAYRFHSQTAAVGDLFAI